MATNWRAYGLSQSRGSLPSGPVTVMVHMASVWVPFTSESKEAIASYPEIQKELRLALQAVGRKLGMYLRRRLKVKHEGERRQHLPPLPGRGGHGRQRHQPASTARSSTSSCWRWPRSKTAEADVKLDDRGKPIEEEDARGFRRQRADRRAERTAGIRDSRRNSETQATNGQKSS